MSGQLPPIPRPDITDARGNLKPPWQAWFEQLRKFVVATPAGGGGVVPYTRQINTTAPLAGGGDLTADRTLTLATNGVTNAYLAQMAAKTIKGNATASPANAQDLTASQVKTLLAISLTTDVTGTLQAAQEPAHTGDVANAAGSLTLTIQANAVTNAKLAQASGLTVKGNNTAGTANVTDLTASQVKALLAINLVSDTTGTLTTVRGGTGVTGASLGAAAGVALADNGTFTPTAFGATTAGATTYTAQVGSYTRIGDRLFFQCTIQWSAATGTGQLSIGSLPFNANATANNYVPVSIWYAGTDAAQSYMGLIAPGANVISIYSHIASTGQAAVAMPASGNMVISGHYQL